jgi:hypothetical protein
MSSFTVERSIAGLFASASDISILVAGVGERGGVWAAEVSLSPRDLFCRLLGGESGDSERSVDEDGVAEDVEAGADEVEVEGRTALFVAAAAILAACVTGTWMPRLGSDSDLRRVLYGMVSVWERKRRRQLGMYVKVVAARDCQSFRDRMRNRPRGGRRGGYATTGDSCPSMTEKLAQSMKSKARVSSVCRESRSGKR